ncbi:copper transporter [Goodfellowiella coeruleoviolacea]|uniref:Copper transport outer membrane protein, MctB n=1 Tax=Goodfellowiella coeruleoviolacea TaxID=334858 RepID=A0AAE3GKU9_9PSEU|nr:copper transporter [Goodfellowiella coeruleoviolacea]MCP2170117.1 Copper transport outer membrane protein, MctB [Goodfellowiella coeruleoviolacea]
MISLRYHLISVAVVFLALAVGIALGSTSVGEVITAGLAGHTRALDQQVNDLRADRDALSAKLAGTDRFAASVGPLAVRGQLDGRSVVLVTTEDAEPAERDELARLLASAGASVTGEVVLTNAFTDPARSEQLRALVFRLLPAAARLPVAADSGSLAGGLLASLLLVNRDGQEPRATPEETTRVLTGLVHDGFVRPSQGLRPAQLAVLLTGSAYGRNAAADRAGVLARVAGVLDRSGAGAVLAGRTGSAEATGPVGVVRADASAAAGLSTVDHVDTAVGRVATVLALREQAGGGSGQYGLAGTAQAPAPDPVVVGAG